MQRVGLSLSGDWDTRSFTHVLDIFSFTLAPRGILQLPEFVDHAGSLLGLVAQSIPRIVVYFPSYNQFLLLLEVEWGAKIARAGRGMKKVLR